jgi:hypothetical protein
VDVSFAVRLEPLDPEVHQRLLDEEFCVANSDTPRLERVGVFAPERRATVRDPFVDEVDIRPLDPLTFTVDERRTGVGHRVETEVGPVLREV